MFFDVLFEKEPKGIVLFKKEPKSVLFFGAKKRTKRNIHPFQAFPYMGRM